MIKQMTDKIKEWTVMHPLMQLGAFGMSFILMGILVWHINVSFDVIRENTQAINELQRTLEIQYKMQ